MANIRPKDLPSDPNPSAADVTVIDGTTTRQATLTAIVNAGRPLANQAEAEAGTDPAKAMTPLTTAQAIAAQGATQFASAAQGATADSALQPDAIGVTVQPFGATLASLEGLPLASGDILYVTGPDTIARLPAGVDGQVVRQDAGLPSWGNATGLGDMLAANNLSDLADKATALDNLGATVGMKTQAAAEAYNPASGPDFIDLAFLDADQVGGSGGRYIKEMSEPTVFPKFQIAEGSWYGLRQKKHWRIEEFGAKEWDGVVDGSNNPTNPVYSDTALSRIIARLGEGDVIDLGSMRLLFNNAVHLINGIERVKLVSNGKQRFMTLCSDDSGNLHITNCPGFMAEGQFDIEGPETLTSWEALADVTARSQKRGIFHLDDGCHDAVFDGLFKTSNTRSPFIVEASRNPLVRGWRHTGFLPDAGDIATGGAIPPYGTVDPNYLMTIRMLDCDAGTASNIRSTNHGSTFVNGGGGERVRCHDVYGTHMHDNVVYNSSGDDFLAYDVHGEHVIGTIAKSRGGNATLRSIKGNHFVVGALLSPIDGIAGSGGLIDDVDVDTGLIAAQVDDVSGFFIDKTTLRGVVASNMKGTSGVIQTQTSGSAGLTIENCNLSTYDATWGLLLDGGVAGEGNGTKHLSVLNNTFQTGNAAIQASKFRELEISGNKMDGMTAAAIVIQLIECFDGMVTRNRSTDTSKRILFNSTSGAGCKRLRGIHNDMFVYGGTSLNEWWGNLNKHLVDTSIDVPFRVGQMCFALATGKAMVSDATAATTDWKLLY